MRTKDRILNIAIGLSIGIPLAVLAAGSRTGSDELIEPYQFETESESAYISFSTSRTETVAAPAQQEEDTAEAWIPYSFIPLDDAAQSAIKELADRYEISYDLVMAWAGKESSWDPEAIGDNGHAYGLFQFWSEYWEATAESYGLNMYDPIDQTELALIELTGNLDKYSGDITKALNMHVHNSPEDVIEPNGRTYVENIFAIYDWIMQESEAEDVRG